MKSKLLTLFSLVLLIGFSACTKTEYYPEENPNRTIYIDIPASNWVPNAAKTVWAATANVPEIDNLILTSGTVLADISFDDRKTFTSLSHVYSQDGYRMEYSKGLILVDVQATDGDFAIANPSKAVLKVILIDSKLID